MNLPDRHAVGRRAALVRLLLAQLAPDLGPLDRQALDVVVLDLVEEPGVID